MSLLRKFEEENRPDATPQIPALPVAAPANNPMQLADAGSPSDEPIIPPVELQDTLQAPIPQTQQAAPQQSNMPGMLQPDNLDRSPRIPFEEITVDVNVPEWERIRIPTAPMPTAKPNNVDVFLDTLGNPSQSQILQPFNQQQPSTFDRNPFLEFLTSIFGGKEAYEQYYRQGVGQLGGLSGIAYGLGLPLNVVSGVAADLGRLGAAVSAGREALIDPNWLSQATRESTNLADFARRAAKRYSDAYIQQLGATIPAGPGTYTQQALLGRQFSFADERTNERGDFNPLGLLPDFGTYKRGVDVPETELSQMYRNNGQISDAITSIIGVPTQAFIQAMSGNKEFKIPKFSDWLADRFKTMENDPGNYYRTLAGFGLDAIVDGGIADLPGYVSRAIERSTSKAVTKAVTPRNPSSSIVLSQPSIGFAEPRTSAAQQSGPNWTYVRGDRTPDGSVWNRAEPYQQAPRPPEVDIIDADFNVVSRTDGQTDTPLIPPYLSNAPRITSDARLPDGSPWVKDMAELRLPDGTLWQRIETLDVRPRQIKIPVPELPMVRVNGMVLDAELLKTYLRSPTGLIEINDLQLPGSRQFDMLPGQEPMSMPMLSGQPAPSALTGASPSQGQLLPGIEMFPPIETMPPTSPMAPPRVDAPAPGTAPRSLVDEPPIEGVPGTDPAVSPIAPPAVPTPPTAPRSMIEEPPIELAPSANKKDADKLIDSIVSTLYRKPSEYSEGLIDELGDQLSRVGTKGVLRLQAVENYLGSIFRQLPQLPEQIKRDILDMTPAGVVEFLTTTSLLPKGLGEKVLDDVAEIVKLELPSISELIGRLKNPDVVNDDAAFREVVNSLPETLRGEPTDQVYRKLLQNLQNTQTSAELSIARLATLQEYFDEFSEQFDTTVTPETLIDETTTDIYLGTRLSNDASIIGAKAAAQPERAAASAVSPVGDAALAGTPRLIQFRFSALPRIMPVQLTESLNRTLAEVLDDNIRLPYLTKLGEFYDITADGRILNTSKLVPVGETALDDVASPTAMRASEVNSRLDPEAPYNLQAQMIDEMEEILSESYNEVDNLLDDMYSSYDELEDYMATRVDMADVPDASLFYEQSIRELLEVDDDLVKAFDPPIKARTSKRRFLDFAESIREALLDDNPDLLIDSFVQFRNRHYSMREAAEELYDAATSAYTRAKEDLGIEVPFDLFPAIDEIC